MEATILAAPTDREHAISYLYRENYERMVRLAFLMTSDRELAEEVVQEAFVKVWKGWSRILKDGAAPAYLRTAVVNQSRSRLRRRQLESTRKPKFDPLPSDPEAARRIDIGRVLLSLPQRQRACVVLRYYEDLSEQQCAEILGVKLGTIKSQTHKGLKNLQKQLGGVADGIR